MNGPGCGRRRARTSGRHRVLMKVTFVLRDWPPGQSGKPKRRQGHQLLAAFRVHDDQVTV